MAYQVRSEIGSSNGTTVEGATYKFIFYNPGLYGKVAITLNLILLLEEKI